MGGRLLALQGSLLVAVGMATSTAGLASAEPTPVIPEVPGVGSEAAATPVADSQPTASADDGAVLSSAPSTSTSPDGWTLTISATDEVQKPVAPLTTAISTREYEVGGVFNAKLSGDGDTPEGTFEVGYQIGCGIDMSTSNGVSLTGSAGISPSIGYFGFDFPGVLPDGLLPGIGGNLGGAITVGLKPGIINVVPVTKKKFESSAPWVSISQFRIKIDGCVGESFIRSYATLTKSNNSGDAILSWYGATKAV